MTIARKLALAAALAVVVAAAGTAVALGTGRQQAFPHERHARLFPFCEGCHVMDEAGRTAMYPTAALCARCHDGTQAERVTWAPPSARPTLLRFEHTGHATAAAAETPAIGCASCHANDSTVLRSEPGRCLGCHAHPAARGHLTDAKCETCHSPVVATNVPADITLSIPAPPGHEGDGFLAGHGSAVADAGTTCQYCHARQQCASCHVNAPQVAAIEAMPVAPPRLRLAPIEARYPEPASHEAPDFGTAHGRDASPASCSTCHTRNSCTTCHTGTRMAVIDALPARTPGGPQGVALERHAPPTHASPSFATGHGTLAAADARSCSTCHTTDTCAQCHNSPGRAVFHPPDFMVSHSASAYAGRLECANCHDAKAFCRACHETGGQVPQGRLLSAVYHDAEPLWLLRHGGAARRGLESCTSCHAQRDCLQCHSTLGAFRVNPHGPGFDARRAQQRNPIICKACHIGDPIGR